MSISTLLHYHFKHCNPTLLSVNQSLYCIFPEQILSLRHLSDFFWLQLFKILHFFLRLWYPQSHITLPNYYDRNEYKL